MCELLFVVKIQSVRTQYVGTYVVVVGSRHLPVRLLPVRLLPDGRQMPVRLFPVVTRY